MEGKLLVVCAADGMVWVLLRPWLTALQRNGLEVHIACPRGSYFSLLADQGFHMHEVSLRRRFNPLRHILPVWQLYRLIRRDGFTAVNTHGPVAAAVGRTAAWLAGCRRMACTVHGFYFHENMARIPRGFYIAVEWLLGRITTSMMFVSEEDQRTALRLGIAKTEAEAAVILNGVDLGRFNPRAPDDSAVEALRRELSIPDGSTVVGIVGRIVREKGYREFLAMAKSIAQAKRDVTFLVIGDTLASDRDQFGAEFRRSVDKAGLTDRFVFTGIVPDVHSYLRLMDIFVLPSYREGLPRSVLEAMATGLPVVATNIRGCREAVVHGETGLIVPPRDAEALRSAVTCLLDNPDVARKMGAAGRVRACEVFDERFVQRRFVDAVTRLMGDGVAMETELCAR